MPGTNKKGLWLRLLALSYINLVSATTAEAYPWPLSPMDVQHDICATFCECRGDRDHFHDAVDIPLGYGGAVLSVADGTVLSLDPSGANAWIRVGRYAYVHVNPNPDLHVGDTVLRGEVVGTTNEQGHIHFKDGGGASGTTIINPLRHDGLAPFEDHYLPTVASINFYRNGTTQIFPTAQVSGLVDIVAQAFDRTDMGHWGSNNGIYSIGWEIFEPEGMTSVEGPHFPFTFNAVPSNSYVKNVYFPGSNTSTYYYTVTNQIVGDGWWDTRQVELGRYLVAVYCVDTRDNWDTTTVLAQVSEQDVTPPKQPVLLSAVGHRDNRLTITWQANEDPDLKGYRLFHSYDGISWFCNFDEHDLSDTATQLMVSPFQNDQSVYFTLTAVDSAILPNESAESDIYGTRLTEAGAKALVVDGFDRTSDSWTQPSHPFTLSHARALEALGMAFDCCANEAVINGGIHLGDYDAVVWVLGDEGVEDSTFTLREQNLASAYLQGGGSLFLSGSEVGYDLVELGSAADVDFYHQILKANYVTGDAGANVVEGIPGTIFDGMNFAFDDGTHGIYQENRPDAIAARGDSEANLAYVGTDYTAGLQYQGPFGQGTQEGRLVYLGFPFETIYPESTRAAVMGQVMEFFDLVTPAEPGTDDQAPMPREFVLHQNYPNPFNPTTTIAFVLPGGGPRHTTLKIYNLLGQRTRTLLDASLRPGHHTVIWDSRDDRGHPVSSGVYLYVLRADLFVHTRKMVLLK